MIIQQIEINGKDMTELVQQPIVLNQRLDRELDSGEFNYLNHDDKCKDRIQAPLSNYKITLTDSDDETSTQTLEFIGTDKRSLLRGKFGNGRTDDAPLFRHSVALTEPTKLLEGVLIDGFAVSQPDPDELVTVSASGSLSLTMSSFQSGDSHCWKESSTNGYVEIELPHAIQSVEVSVQSSQSVNLLAVYPKYKRSSNENADNWFTVGLSWLSSGFSSLTINYTYTYQTLAINESDSLEKVVNRLLNVTPLHKYNGESQAFVLVTNEDAKKLLQNTLSPQFKWSTQTTLWECLCDIGSVIDAIPRLVADSNGEYRQVTFDLINSKTAETDEMLDDYAIDYAEEVDDRQYNTQLRSVVENIKEE